MLVNVDTLEQARKVHMLLESSQREALRIIGAQIDLRKLADLDASSTDGTRSTLSADMMLE